MRISCNGCRVLRKGCSDSCTIRACLLWIKNPESQAHATLFLAKFYGRAGLLNLLSSGPDHLRPAVFRSLLYEACGRIVNPVYGSVGLLWSGSWHLCHAAVEAVLSGAPITQSVPIPDPASTNPLPPLKVAAYDIRHVPKDAADLHKVAGARTKFKRVGKHKSGGGGGATCNGGEFPREPSQETASQGEGEGSAFTMETEDASHVSQGEPAEGRLEEEVIGLELTLGLGLMGQAGRVERREEREEMGGPDGETCRLDLGL